MTRPRPHSPDGCPPRKIDELRRLMAAEKWAAALAFAARFPRLGAAKAAIERGHQAACRPDFVRGIRRDPAADIAAGIQALREQYEDRQG